MLHRMLLCAAGALAALAAAAPASAATKLAGTRCRPASAPIATRSPGARFGCCGVPGEGETCDVEQASLRFRPGRDRHDGP